MCPRKRKLLILDVIVIPFSSNASLGSIRDIHCARLPSYHIKVY